MTLPTHAPTRAHRPALTSAQAHAGISNVAKKTLCDLIESVVLQALRTGAKDVSMREVQAALERHHDRRVDMSTISSRVNVLVAASRLVRDKANPRPCTVTGMNIQPLSVAAKQAPMFS